MFSTHFDFCSGSSQIHPTTAAHVMIVLTFYCRIRRKTGYRGYPIRSSDRDTRRVHVEATPKPCRGRDLLIQLVERLALADVLFGSAQPRAMSQRTQVEPAVHRRGIQVLLPAHELRARLVLNRGEAEAGVILTSA